MHFEPSFVGAMKENPLFIFLALLLGAAGFVVAIVALLSIGKKPGLAMGMGAAATVLGVLTVIVGFTGSSSGRSHTDRAISAPGLTSNDRARIQAYGYAEARYPIYVGLGMGIIPLMAGGMLFGAGLVRSRKK